LVCSGTRSPNSKSSNPSTSSSSAVGEHVGGCSGLFVCLPFFFCFIGYEPRDHKPMLTTLPGSLLNKDGYLGGSPRAFGNFVEDAAVQKLVAVARAYPIYMYTHFPI